MCKCVCVFKWVSVWSTLLSVWLCKTWWAAVTFGCLFQWFASSRQTVASWTCECAALPCKESQSSALGHMVNTVNSAGCSGGRYINFAIFTSLLMFLMKAPFTLTSNLCPCPFLFWPVHPSSHSPTPHCENKQFPYLIIHFTFMGYPVTTGNLVVE